MRRELDIHGPKSQIFRRIVDIPFDACLAALDSWQRTGQDGEPHPGHGLWRGPIEADRDSGTCSIQVHLARGPLRKPLLMRLTSTAGPPHAPPSNSSPLSAPGPPQATSAPATACWTP